jgi:hypothetical protein
MRDPVVFNNEVFDRAIMACRAVRPQDYDPTRKEMWNKAVATGMPLPPDYPGAVHVPCQMCRIDVQVGPRQQEQLKTIEADIYCLICAVIVSTEAGDINPSVIDLGNPHKE